VDDIIDPSKPIYVEISPKVPMNQVLKAINLFSFKKKIQFMIVPFLGQEVMDQEKVDFCIFLTF
jgi:hypothetical protein